MFTTEKSISHVCCHQNAHLIAPVNAKSAFFFYERACIEDGGAFDPSRDGHKQANKGVAFSSMSIEENRGASRSIGEKTDVGGRDGGEGGRGVLSACLVLGASVFRYARRFFASRLS